jgi:hypothetical protein
MNHIVVRTQRRRICFNNFIIEAVASLHSGTVLFNTFPLSCSAQLAAKAKFLDLIKSILRKGRNANLKNNWLCNFVNQSQKKYLVIGNQCLVLTLSGIHVLSALH